MSDHSPKSYYGSIVLAAIVGAVSAFLILSIGVQKEFTSPSSTIPSLDNGHVRQGIETLRDEEAATIAVVNSVSPAVVSVSIFKEQRQALSRTGPTPFDDYFFFGPQPQPPAPQNNNQEPQKVQIGGGTGFIIESDGHILTNRHVVADTDAEYRVTLNDGREFIAKVLARDPVNDLAIIKIDANNLSVAPLGDSDSIAIGQTAIAIGNALSEFENTVTRGIISGINRRVVAGNGLGDSEVLEEAIQTDAAINPGNSGGPLINLHGEVIGMNTAVSREGQSVGFATPINLAKRAIESVKKYGKIIRPWLGVRYVLLTPNMAKANNLKVDHGALVVRGSGTDKEPAIVPDSPAAKAGIQENDVIVSVNDKDVTLKTPLTRLLSQYTPGDTIVLKVLRKEETKEIKVTLGTFDEK